MGGVVSEEVEEVFRRLRAALGLTSDRALAERLGMNYGAFSARKSRGSLPRAEIDTLCEASGLSTEWVYEGKGQQRPNFDRAIQDLQEAQRVVKSLALEDEEARQVAEFLQLANMGNREQLLPLVRKLGFVTVPRYQVAAAAGDGQVVYAEDDQVVDTLAFRPEWLREIGLSARNLAVIAVKGDSMADTLSDGDLVMVDTSPAERQSPGIYVLAKGDALLIKRLHFKVSGAVEIRSDNKAYPTEVMSAREFADVRIVGRMVRRLVR